MTTRITIVSGFLGAGKTTLIRRLIGGVCAGERLAVIENEFGDAAIDGDVFRSGRLQVREIQSGCICCSLATDFLEALQALAAEYRPDRILIEPSGVARLSDIRAVVARAVSAGGGSLAAGGVITVADATRCAMYHEQFGTFYGDQLQSAETILLSRTDTALPSDVEAAEALIRRLNPRAVLLTQPWDRLEPDARRTCRHTRGMRCTRRSCRWTRGAAARCCAQRASCSSRMAARCRLTIRRGGSTSATAHRPRPRRAGYA